MRKVYKRVISLLLTFMMVFSAMPATAFAAEESSTEDAIKVYYLNEAEEEVVLPYETGANCQYHYGPPMIPAVQLPCYTVEIPAGQSDLYLKYADFSVNKKPFFGTLSEGVIEEGSQITAAEFLEDAVKVPVGEFADAEEKYIAFYGGISEPAFVLKVTSALEEENAQKLTEAKTSAISELEAYKSADAYRTEQQTELATAIANGKTAINAAETEDDVATALAAAKAEIDKIKTAAELDAETEKKKVIDNTIELIPDITAFEVEGIDVKAFNIKPGLNPAQRILNIYTDKVNGVAKFKFVLNGNNYALFENSTKKISFDTPIEFSSLPSEKTLRIAPAARPITTLVTLVVKLSAACTTPDGNAHTWDNGKVTTEATCKATGVKTYTCTCGKTKEEPIAKAEHTWDDGEITKETSCYAAGEKTFTCTADGCGETKTEPIDTIEHSWDDGEVIKAATCGKEGITLFKCLADGCKETKLEYPEATGNHTWDNGKVTVKPTCINGLKTFKCTTCGDTKTEEMEATKKHSWNDGEVVKEATYYSEGQTKYTCGVCEHTKTETDIPVIENPVFVQEAYYLDENGEKQAISFATSTGDFIYSPKGETKEYPVYTFTTLESIDKVTVVFTDLVKPNNYAQVCEKNKDGVIAMTASQVRGTASGTTMEIPVGNILGTGKYIAVGDINNNYAFFVLFTFKAEHVWDAGVVTKEPTCTEPGETTYTCTYCAEIDVETTETETIDPLGHKFDQEVADEKYLASKADFSNAATYYKSCACGEKGSETFTSGEALGAVIADSVKKEIANYKKADDYREEQKAELAAIIEAANKAIDEATSEDEIKKAVAEAKAAMDIIKTDAQLKAEEEANKPVLPTQLKTPANVKTSNVAKTGKVKVGWNKVEGAAKYQVYRATKKNGKYTLVKTVTGTSYTDSSTKVGKSFYFKVKAVSNDQNVTASTFSKAVKGTVDLKMPVVTARSKTKKQVKLTWKKVNSAKKYEIYRATKKNGKYRKIATTTKLSYTNRKLKSGKTYYYKVKAVAKKKAANSALSKVDKCKSK